MSPATCPQPFRRLKTGYHPSNTMSPEGRRKNILIPFTFTCAALKEQHFPSFASYLSAEPEAALCGNSEKPFMSETERCWAERIFTSPGWCLSSSDVISDTVPFFPCRLDQVCPADAGADQQPQRAAAADAHEQGWGGAQALPLGRSKCPSWLTIWRFYPPSSCPVDAE